jgi:hypothetical protein
MSGHGKSVELPLLLLLSLLPLLPLLSLLSLLSLLLLLSLLSLLPRSTVYYATSTISIDCLSRYLYYLDRLP